MKTKDLTLKNLEAYFEGRKTRAGYKESVKLYKDLKVHADGDFPEELIHERRPNESTRIQKYRRTVYKAITKAPVQRVLASLTKIRRSVDWGIIHPREAYPPAVPLEEQLITYTETEFPRVESFENWLFSVCFKNYALDANGVCMWIPINREVKENEYLQPVPMIFNSPNVMEYVQGEIAILGVSSDTDIEDPVKQRKMAQRYYVLNDEVIQLWKRGDSGFTQEYEWKHELGILPAFELGGMYKETIGTHIIRESRLSPMQERLDEAAREYSDMQAEVVQHIHSERWQWATQKCTQCTNSQGIAQGFINSPKEGEGKITCPSCQGQKTVAGSPYVNMVVRPSKEGMGEQAAPIPPAGYITKETKIVEIQDKRIDEHIHKALGSLNMQFLDQTPLNISGKGKEVDRDELNNFVHSVAQDLVRIAKRSMIIMAEYRYRISIKEDKKRKSIQPNIKVPQKFDLLSSSYLADEIERLKKAGANPVIIAALEKEYASKKFYNDPDVRDLLALVLELDPLASISEEDKMIRKANKGITDVDYIISSNIMELVKELAKDEKFIGESRDKQMEALRKLAEEKLKKMNASKVEPAPAPEPPAGEPNE